MTGRRKGRHICGWIMSAAMAFAVWGLIAAGIFDKGIYNTSLLNESISASSFLEQRYDGFEAEVQGDFGKLTDTELIHHNTIGYHLHSQLSCTKNTFTGAFQQVEPEW